MSLDIHALSLILSLMTLLNVIVLAIQYQKDKSNRGFFWWIIGMAFIGIHFFLLFLQNFLLLGNFRVVFENFALVAGSLALYQGVILFFDQPRRDRVFIIFSVLYTLVTIIFYSFGNLIFPSAVSALSIAILSTLTAGIIYKTKSSSFQFLSTIISLSFLINALFFMTHGVLWFVLQVPTLPELPSFMQSLSYFVIFIHSTLWTFGFIFLMNQRSMTKTTEIRDKFSLMFETIPDAVLITRLSDGAIVDVNQGFTKLSGYSADDVRGKTTLDANLWFDPAERSKFAVILTETGIIENKEFQFRRKNGRPLIGLLSSRTININDEPHILNVVHDITSRKKMEEKLRENEQKYRFLAENSGDVVWHINKSHRIDYISPADEVQRGYKREEVLGTQIWSIFKPEGIQLVREKIEHHQEVEQVGNNMNVTRFEIEQRCKDGSWIWTEIVAAPHYDENGNLVGYHGISRDITQRKRLVDQLYRQATTDDLTQVPNRRHFMNLAEIELRRAKRYHHPLSIVVIDFDGLKGLNDTYGHLAGDRALSVFSKIVLQIIRDVDVLGRFGGDEFLLLLPETDSEHAYLVMDRIQEILASSPIFYGKKSFTLSISSGIASIDNWTDTLEDLLDRADKALYESKNRR